MKKKIILICIVCILLLLTTILILYPKRNSEISYEVFKARADISSYFNAIIKEDYLKASEYISFFNSDDNTPLESNDELKNNWISQISDLAEKNIKVEAVKSLKVKTIDGVIFAQITLSINDVGYSYDVNYVLELDSNEKAGLFDIKYKVKDVTDEELRLEIEDVLSGIVK